MYSNYSSLALIEEEVKADNPLLDHESDNPEEGTFEHRPLLLATCRTPYNGSSNGHRLLGGHREQLAGEVVTKRSNLDTVYFQGCAARTIGIRGDTAKHQF